MNKRNGMILIAVIGLILVVTFFVLMFNNSNESEVVTGEKEQVVLDNEEKEEDVINEEEEVDEEMEEEIVYDLLAPLIDVTEGATIRGVNTGGNSSGSATAVVLDGDYTMIATFKDLPDPLGTDFYEGWVVRTEPFAFISTGEVVLEDGVYTNQFVSETDYSDYDQYVLTLEPDDGDPAPADHIVEGFYEMTQ